MIKKLRVTVDGKPYDVSVEVEDEAPKTSTSSGAGAASSVEPPPVSPSPPEVSHSTGSTSGAIVSPLAGRVTAISVKIDQVIKQGDHVLTLEAMKMNTFVFAHKGGKVTEIKIAVGDAVQENEPLILLV